MDNLPLTAFRYCEAVRTASSIGWMIHPPIDFAIKFNGIDILIYHNQDWVPLSQAFLPGLTALWNQKAPPELKGLAPPYLTKIASARGVLQIWSGYLYETDPGWVSLSRGLVNTFQSNQYRAFEGIVESDVFRPSPLFINIQLLDTENPIYFRFTEPLFQVQAFKRDSFLGNGQSAVIGAFGSGEEPMEASELDWAAFRKTIRALTPDETHQLGDYAREVRKGRRTE